MKFPKIGEWVELVVDLPANQKRRTGFRSGAIGRVIPPNEVLDTGKILFRPLCFCMIADENDHSEPCGLLEYDNSVFLNQGQYRLIEETEIETLKAEHITEEVREE